MKVNTQRDKEYPNIPKDIVDSILLPITGAMQTRNRVKVVIVVAIVAPSEANVLPPVIRSID